MKNYNYFDLIFGIICRLWSLPGQFWAFWRVWKNQDWNPRWRIQYGRRLRAWRYSDVSFLWVFIIAKKIASKQIFQNDTKTTDLRFQNSPLGRAFSKTLVFIDKHLRFSLFWCGRSAKTYKKECFLKKIRVDRAQKETHFIQVDWTLLLDQW